MSNDPQGPDAPKGANAKSNDFAAAEDFLGLHADSNGTDSELSDSSLENSFPAEPELNDGIYDPDSESAGSERLLDPVAKTQVEDPPEGSEEGDPFGVDPSGDDDGLDLDFDEEGASWLMEFDGAESDEEQEEAFAQAFEAGEEDEDDFRPSLAEPEMAGAASPWLGRAILAVVSVAVGVVGSKFIADDKFNSAQQTPTEIAKVESPTAGTQPGQVAQPGNKPNAKGVAGLLNTGGGKPANKPNAQKPALIADPAPQTAPQGDPVVKTDLLAQVPAPMLDKPANSGGSKRPVMPGEVPQALTPTQTPEPEPSGLVIQVGDTGAVGDVPPVELEPTSDLPMMDEEHGRTRQASKTELASIYTGDAIPRDAVHGDKKIMTPSVGEVRVLLYAGEIFEGKLYAVGNRRIWLDTKIGKMALLEWQIDSFEKIADSTTMALGSQKTVAGLQSVRVRTTGGVFYGKLVKHEGSTVTIITASGARLTLEDAKLATAGRSMSHVVDASNMVVTKADPK